MLHSSPHFTLAVTDHTITTSVSTGAVFYRMMHAMNDRFDQQIALRLQHVTRGRTYRALSALTGVSDETARRHILIGRPSAEFCARLCTGLGIQEPWLLNGRGGVLVDPGAERLLRDATVDELTAALGQRLQRVRDHVEELEQRAEALGRAANERVPVNQTSGAGSVAATAARTGNRAGGDVERGLCG